MKKTLINGKWQLSAYLYGEKKFTLSAFVPGDIALDLIDGGYLPKDIFFSDNVFKLKEYENYDFEYSTTFNYGGKTDNAQLEFNGVSCIAEYFLNGEKVGETDNALIPHTVDVSGKIKKGKNDLKVYITSPIKYAFNKNYDLLNIRLAWYEEASALRVAPSTYGWDIAPRNILGGIWRDVYVIEKDDISFKQAYVVLDGNCFFSYEIDCKWQDFKDIEVGISGKCGDDEFSARRKAPFNKGNLWFGTKNMKLWWPKGYGEPNLYDVTATIYKGGKAVHEKHFKYGHRKVEFNHTVMTDGVNGKFQIKINGVEIMLKGTDHVPLSVFHSQDKDKYKTFFENVNELGCNIVRCWGGNVYEDDEFFDYCDENGIMVWQDFAFACYSNPQDEDYLKKVEKEATCIVKKLRLHPSLVLWCGDNEVDLAYYANGIAPSSNRISREILPKVIVRHDIARPFLLSSVTYPDNYKEYADKGYTFSEHHLWPRKYYKDEAYTGNKSHVLSEIGFPSVPNRSSLEKFISKEQLKDYKDGSKDWNLHCGELNLSNTQVKFTQNGINVMFGGVPDNLDDYITATQIHQAEALKFTIERARIGRPYKTGVIWWQMQDIWPQVSNGIIDYYNQKKLAFDYVKTAQQPFIIAVGEPENGKCGIYALNDSLEKRKGSVKITDKTTGKILFNGEFTTEINTSDKIGEIDVSAETQTLFMIEWEQNGKKGSSHYLFGKAPFDLKQVKKWLNV